MCRVGERISLIGRSILWSNGTVGRAPWLFEKGRTFEVIQVTSPAPGQVRVVIGNHRLNNGPITHGVTGAIVIQF